MGIEGTVLLTPAQCPGLTYPQLCLGPSGVFILSCLITGSVSLISLVQQKPHSIKKKKKGARMTPL